MIHFDCRGTENANDVYNMLKKNFERAYNGQTRAPFGLYMHAAWFFGYDFHYEGYKMFIDYLGHMDNVWIVPIHAGLVYRKNPVSNEDILNGAVPEFHCDNFPTPPSPCVQSSCG